MSGLTGCPPAYTRAQHSLETTFLSWRARKLYSGNETMYSTSMVNFSYVLLLSWKSPGLQVTQVGRSDVMTQHCTSVLQSFNTHVPADMKCALLLSLLCG